MAKLLSSTVSRDVVFTLISILLDSDPSATSIFVESGGLPSILQLISVPNVESSSVQHALGMLQKLSTGGEYSQQIAMKGGLASLGSVVDLSRPEEIQTSGLDVLQNLAETVDKELFVSGTFVY